MCHVSRVRCGRTARSAAWPRMQAAARGGGGACAPPLQARQAAAPCRVWSPVGARAWLLPGSWARRPAGLSTAPPAQSRRRRSAQVCEGAGQHRGHRQVSGEAARTRACCGAAHAGARWAAAVPTARASIHLVQLLQRLDRGAGVGVAGHQERDEGSPEVRGTGREPALSSAAVADRQRCEADTRQERPMAAPSWHQCGIAERSAAARSRSAGRPGGGSGGGGGGLLTCPASSAPPLCRTPTWSAGRSPWPPHARQRLPGAGAVPWRPMCGEGRAAGAPGSLS